MLLSSLILQSLCGGHITACHLMPVLCFATMAAREVEIKFATDDIRWIRRRLRQLGFRQQTPRRHEVNTLYDFPDSVLRRRGELLRLRRYGDQWKLTHKGKGRAGRHKSREELETSVSDGNTTAAMLSRIGLVPTFHYEKFRSEWSDSEGHVVLDETPIGNFAEIEGPSRWIDRTARALDVPHGLYITDSYAQLFMKWKRHTGSASTEMTFRACRPQTRSFPKK